MGGFGSRGGVFLMAPIKRRIAEGAIDVFGARDAIPRGAVQELRIPNDYRDFFETVYADDSCSANNPKNATGAYEK